MRSYYQAGYQLPTFGVGGSRIMALVWPFGTSWMTQRWPRSAWAPPRPSSSAMDGGFEFCDGKIPRNMEVLYGFIGKSMGKTWEIMEKLWKIIYEWRFLAGKTIEIIGANFGPLKIDYLRSEDEQQFWNWGIFHRKKQQSSKESYRISRII